MLQLLLGRRPDEPLTVLCLGAHSDDIEIGCGGTILRLLGERVVQLHWVTFGARGDREAEARDSAGAYLAGAASGDITIHGFVDGYFPHHAAEIKDLFEAIKRTCAPDLIFTHRRADEHQDHRVVAELTWNTFRDHMVLEYEIPKYEGDLGQPNVFVPLTEELAERKVELLMKHFPSQRPRRWFRPATFQAMMTLRGNECNAPDGYAEAFHLRKAVL